MGKSCTAPHCSDGRAEAKNGKDTSSSLARPLQSIPKVEGNSRSGHRAGDCLGTNSHTGGEGGREKGEWWSTRLLTWMVIS